MKKIAIIGASYLQLPLVLKAKELKCQTICFAIADGAVCKEFSDFFFPISIVEKDQILKICTDFEVDGICTIASDLAVETVNYVADSLSLTGNSVYSSQYVREKHLMKSKLNQFNLPTIKYFEFNSDKLDELTKLEHFPYVVKPSDRSGSLGVILVYSFDELLESVKRAITLSFNSIALVEEYVIGNEISVETISFSGEHYILAFTDKIISPPPYFVELAHRQPANLEPVLIEKITALIPTILDSLQIKNGASHIEFIISRTGDVFIMEVGARMAGDLIGSHLVYYSTGYDYLKAVLEISMGEFNPPSLHQSKHAIVLFKSNETKINLNSIENLPENLKLIEDVNWNNQSEGLTNSGDRCGFSVFAQF